jgi:hypothetical protein
VDKSKQRKDSRDPRNLKLKITMDKRRSRLSSRMRKMMTIMSKRNFERSLCQLGIFFVQTGESLYEITLVSSDLIHGVSQPLHNI